MFDLIFFFKSMSKMSNKSDQCKENSQQRSEDHLHTPLNDEKSPTVEGKIKYLKLDAVDVEQMTRSVFPNGQKFDRSVVSAVHYFLFTLVTTFVLICVQHSQIKKGETFLHKHVINGLKNMGFGQLIDVIDYDV